MNRDFTIAARGPRERRVRPRLLRVIAGVLACALAAQLVLGWGLGVWEAWIAVLLVAAIVSVLVFVDAGPASAGAAADGSYDVSACAKVGLAVGAAVACLYLPLPWGGLGAAAIFVVIVALGVSAHRRGAASNGRRRL